MTAGIVGAVEQTIVSHDADDRLVGCGFAVDARIEVEVGQVGLSLLAVGTVTHQTIAGRCFVNRVAILIDRVQLQNPMKRACSAGWPGERTTNQSPLIFERVSP